MKLNFNVELHSKSSNITSPKDLFMSLKRGYKFQYLWDVQSDVLSKWNSIRKEKDIIVKMNTGAGKTLVALLILQSLSNENGGNSIYVVPDNFLKEQVKNTATELGLRVTTDKDSMDFLQKNYILLINANELVNGKSAFGMRKANNINIDNIIIDDAHTCIATIKNQFSIKINKESSLYNKILATFKMPIARYMHISEKNLLDKLSEFSREHINIPYWIWNDNVIQIKEEICNYMREAEDDTSKRLLFTYPLIEDMLELCHCIIGWDGSEITPYSIPIEKIRNLQNAKHRVFLSATLPDLTVFNSILDIDPQKIKTNVITPEKAYDIGERLIIFPQYIKTDLADNDILLRVNEYGKRMNVLVIVPSNSRANYWMEKLKDVQVQRLDSSNIQSGIESVKNGQFTGITIVINKYDGIDLSNDSCRLVVIDKLPNASSMWDKYEMEVLPDSCRIKAELIQKIEQGMGRGIRSNTDYCGVILMNPSLIKTLYSNDTKSYFSEASQVQMAISEKLWEQMEKSDDIFDALEYVYTRDDEWVTFSKEKIINCEYNNTIKLNELEIICRKAFNAFKRGFKEDAVRYFDEYLNGKKDISLDEKGYIKMLKAEYEFHINPAKSQETLKSAFADNRKVIKPQEGVVYNRLVKIGAGSQAQCIKEYVKNHTLVDINSTLDKLKFEEGTSKEFESAIAELGLMLGFQSQRPEQEYNNGGPDNLWYLGDAYWIIECKNGTTTKTISKSDIEQLLSSMQWFQNEYKDKNFHPIIIHNSDIADKLANPNPQMKVINPLKLASLTNAVAKFYANIFESKISNNEEEIAKLIVNYNLTCGTINKYVDKIKTLS